MRICNRLGVFTLFATALISVVGCGGKGGGGNSTTTPPPPATYTIGGTISGLTATGLVLQDNGGDSLTVGANASSFTFATPITSGGAYSATVLTQPAGLNCTVTSGSGTASANVTTVSIVCVQAYTIGGSVFGLSGTGLVLQDNGGNNLTVGASAKSYAFVFPNTIPSAGVPYSVTVLSDPAGQSCTVAGPIGTAKASVTNVDVSCTANSSASYIISGTVTGLKGAGLILQDQAGVNDNDLLPVDANGNFTFVDPIPAGGTYNVTVLTPPPGRHCVITNGTGAPIADVSNVSVVCLGEWTWIGGNNIVGSNGEQPGVYGTLGTPDPANIPGGRQQELTWTDSTGKFWLFGGYGEDSTGVGFGGQLNDLWRFDPALGTAGEWTWMGGSNVTPPSTSLGAAGEPGSYGTLGVTSPLNNPGGREQVASWLDASGSLWLFGGEGIDETGGTGQLNDLWKFDPTKGPTGEWTWLGGNSHVPFVFGGQIGVYGAPGTPDPANIPGGRYGSMTWKDASGNFWLFGGQGTDVAGTQGYLNDLWQYAPSTGEWTWMGGSSSIGDSQGQSGTYGTQGTPDPTNIPGGRDAGVTWTDASGNFWLFGGLGIDAAGNLAYLNDLWKYTPSAIGNTGQWTWMGGGTTAPQAYSGLSGVYGVQGTADPANIPGGRYSAISWTDASGMFWLFSGSGYDSIGLQGSLNDLWKYTPSVTGDTGQWTWMGGSTIVGHAQGQGQSGIYGMLGIAGSNNNPGGRFGSASWIDSTGNLWLFGGDGFDSTLTGMQGNLNDLWKYQP
ncbi:Kelch repeat-containing protein [Granulicella mallensis]|uniref:Uncharacterized protein n=1 Tax=Granulicella mallensis (strain ATCC BAA-1857 / DSM 23137 / MP5ACTX8) TaxID=682795 RepID=G8NUB5_GRAMM|nr:kelch repeat-containing protein [Granulicella mallensis]AEU35271.1 hypothetical protein AciX8_0922 [Granulicella mallensis MP5ACTX8]